MRCSKPIYVLLILTSCLTAFFYYQSSIKTEISRNNVLKQSYAERIKLVLASVAQPIAGFERLNKNIKRTLSLQEFNAFAEIMFDPKKHIAILYSPNGINTYIYPLQGNEQALGRDVITSPLTNIDSKKAIKNKKTTITGPYSLPNGTKTAIVIRNPIFTQNDGKEHFWGFISLVLESPTFLDVTGLLNVQELNYQCSLLGLYQDKPTPIVQSSDFDITKDSYIDFDLYNSTWRLSIYRPQVFSSALYYALGLLCLLLAAATVLYHILGYFEKHNKLYKQQLVKDKLTDSYTRSFLEEYVFDNTFCLLFLDLNKFKPVNDTYGHEIGDKLLISYVDRLKHNLKKGTPIVRMGGDEFLLIINEQISEKDILQIKKRIQKISQQVFVIDTHRIEIGVSIGYAFCPQDSSNLNELITIADKAMYKEKHASKP